MKGSQDTDKDYKRSKDLAFKCCIINKLYNYIYNINNNTVIIKLEKGRGNLHEI